MKQYRSFRLAAAAAAALIISGCPPREQPASEQGYGAAQRTVRVAAILSQTGKADFIGKPEADLLRALVDAHRETGQGPRLEIVYHDSGGDADTALQQYETLARDPSILAVIGPSTSGEAIAIANKSDELRLPALTLAASRKIVVTDDGQPRRWMFKFAQNDDLAAERLFRVMGAKKHANLAMLYSDDGFGKSGAAVVTEAARVYGGVNLVQVAPFPPDLVQPESFVAGLPAHADAVLIWGTAPGPSLLVKAIRRAAPGTPIYLSHGNASPAFVESTGPASEGCIVVGSRVLMDEKSLNEENPADDAVLRYRAFWLDHFPPPPSHFAGHARDALQALLTVLNSRPVRGREDVRAGLEQLRNFNGVTGTFAFSPRDHAGLSLESFKVYVIKGGQFVPLPE